METVVERIKEAINNGERIYIAGHINPDGDAVGACYAAARMIEQMGQTPLVLLSEYSEKFSYLDGERFMHKGRIEELTGGLFIALDTSDKARLGAYLPVFERADTTINIDHHVSNPRYAEINCVVMSSSACEVVYDVFSPYVELTKDIAAALYTGIVSDTGGLRHNSTTPKTHTIIAKLIATGIDFSKICNEIMYAHSEAEARVFGVALKHLVVRDGIAFSFINACEMAACKAAYSDLDGIVEYLLNVRGVGVSVLFTERDGYIKASMRSKSFDVSVFAARFGGGGHKLAAGAEISGKLDDAVDMVICELKKSILLVS